MRLIIDGDGSPVKDTTIEIAKQFELEVVIVTSIDHYSTKEYPKFVKFVYVDRLQNCFANSAWRYSNYAGLRISLFNY